MTVAEYRNYVQGRFVASTRQFDDVDPATGRVVASVHDADDSLVAAAVDAARAALRGPWGETTVEQRAAVLDRIASVIERRAEDFLVAEVGDTGKPAELARSLDIPRGSANFRTFANLIRATGGELYESPTPDGGALNYTSRRPLGVVGVISPWNLPLLLLTWKVAPALACGNTIVANSFLNPDGRIPAVVAANNVYHDFALTAKLGGIAAEQAKLQGKRAAVIAIGGLSGSYFDHEIDIAKDRVVRDADDAANRAFLDRLGKGSGDSLAAEIAAYAGTVKADMGGKHFAWVLGATGGFRGASVLGYGATYGAGAAVVQFHVA
jgi:aminomuconate-semialdehyde/2-hydroxymuconate-6-semialdehyde dehydrogenase